MGKGFTLIELLVVIAVISVLAAAVILIINPSQKIAQANDSRRRTDLTSIRTALEAYYVDNGNYPPYSTPGGWATYINGGCAVETYNALLTEMKTVPDDPLSSQGYHYFYRQIDATHYQLAAHLDAITASDPNYVASFSTSACNPPAGSKAYSVINWVYNSP